MKKTTLLLLLASCVPTEAGIKRNTDDRLSICLGGNVAQNLDSRNICVDEALSYCNNAGFGMICNREELSQKAQFLGFSRPRQDAGDK